MASEAQIRANKANAARSSGPRSDAGKRRSRRSALKSGLSTFGPVSEDLYADEIRALVVTLTAEMGPRSPRGVKLIDHIARLWIRMENAGRHETAAIARRVRNAVVDFDRERFEQAENLLESIHENPRSKIRRLLETPEGVDAMIDAWGDLRDNLTADPKPIWTAAHMELAAHLSGIRSEHARSSRVGALSRGFWGDFAALTDEDGGKLPEEARRKWAKQALIGWIDGELAQLEEDYAAIDFECLELDRKEAPSRALFDPSREAALARRYESEATRNYHKALKEFRRVEAEFAAQPDPSPPPMPRPAPAPAPPPPPILPAIEPPNPAKLGSFREPPRPAVFGPGEGAPEFGSLAYSEARGRDGQVLIIGQPPRPIA